ncbi:MAG: hypothetical protein AB1345_04620 [Chloroflexota bacterium]
MAMIETKPQTKKQEELLRKAYEKPQVKLTLPLETRAGSPLGVNPFDPFNMGPDPNQQ